MHITVLFVFLMFCCITCGNFEEVGQGDKTQTLPNTGQTGTRPKRGERLPNYPKTGALPKVEKRGVYDILTQEGNFEQVVQGDKTQTLPNTGKTGTRPKRGERLPNYPKTGTLPKVEKRGVYDILPQEELSVDIAFQADKGGTLPNTGSRGTRPGRNRLPNYTRWGTLPNQLEVKDHPEQDLLGLLLHSNETLPVKS
ncbi:uncharacterized protein LOC143043646 [Mytilus galloprovincialis]|uniref:uncharacterized protein LOC143043646 n=1 Tax=Mytilus galloprovincialis TaxID=29158 RepID=UPI003F7CA8CE